MIEDPERPKHDPQLIDAWLKDQDSVAGQVGAELVLSEIDGTCLATYTINGPTCQVVVIKGDAKEGGELVYSEGYGITELIEHADPYLSGHVLSSDRIGWGGKIEWEIRPDLFEDDADQKTYTELLNHITARARQLIRSEDFRRQLLRRLGY
jgi:hypothetical protein